jgi:hypothetical protein
MNSLTLDIFRVNDNDPKWKNGYQFDGTIHINDRFPNRPRRMMNLFVAWLVKCGTEGVTA